MIMTMTTMTEICALSFLNPEPSLCNSTSVVQLSNTCILESWTEAPQREGQEDKVKVAGAPRHVTEQPCAAPRGLDMAETMLD